jgi:polyhydroxyalkanoate synthase
MARVKRKEDLGTAAVPSTPTAALPSTGSSSPSELAAQDAPLDPTFGFGTIMPMAMAQMSEAMSRFPGMDWVSRLQGKPPAALRIDQNRLMGLQAEYTQRTQQLFKMAATGDAPELKDRRFSDDSWRDQNQPWGWAAALYLVNSEFLRRTAELLEGDSKTVERVCFAVGQWCDAMAPSNFLATNPEAQRRLVESKGESLRHGIDNLLSDLKKGRISMTDEEAFEVGRNVATSPGAVVFQNELFQLIQYGASTDKVGSRPLLMVPPCINKYYVLDLQPENSLVGFAVSRGHTVFMVSWCNPGPELANLTWDDYVGRGVLEAIRVVREISGSEQINALGFCVGGTLLASALAVLEGRDERPVASMTLMSTFLDFGDPGALGLFIDETVVELREQQLGQGGLMTGRDLSTTFSFLRPNDLVWNYVVGNYLKGEEPPAFDLLYWNGDTTNLPGPMYVYYLRHMYLRNEL